MRPTVETVKLTETVGAEVRAVDVDRLLHDEDLPAWPHRRRRWCSSCGHGLTITWLLHCGNGVYRRRVSPLSALVCDSDGREP
jgi:hypothetical protein